MPASTRSCCASRTRPSAVISSSSALERQHAAGSFTLDTGFVGVPDAQRERGEIAVEGVGTLGAGSGRARGMHRLDVRELNAALQSLSRLPILAAFRYQRPSAAPRRADAGRSTICRQRRARGGRRRAIATTLVTTEGRMLTEIALTVQNRAQVVSEGDAAGGRVDRFGRRRRRTGQAGARRRRRRACRCCVQDSVRLAPIAVTFVYLQAGTPLAKKGEMQMALPGWTSRWKSWSGRCSCPTATRCARSVGTSIERRAMPGFVTFGASGRQRRRGQRPRRGGHQRAARTDSRTRHGHDR